MSQPLEDPNLSSNSNSSVEVKPKMNESDGAPTKEVLDQSSGSRQSVNPPGKTSWGSQFKENFHLYCYNHGLPVSVPQSILRVYYNTNRKIYVNWTLPEDMLDVNGYPNTQYVRNKIRTTKYTPLSFVPKNLMFQFTNIANVYFLLIVILGAFQIFGVSSPGLAAVPLIVIVCITAIKDAFEDWRRAVSDSELNNSPIHLLTGFENSNVRADYVGPWRQFKKKSTKATRSCFGAIGSIFTVFSKKNKNNSHDVEKQSQLHSEDLARVSSVVSDVSLTSSIYASGADARQHRPSRIIPHTIADPTMQPKSRAQFKNRMWKDVNVGDIIRIRANEEVPADIVLLATSDIEGNCYIETKNLDGETNLKLKNMLHCGEGLKHATDLEKISCWVECDPPNKSLYAFKGAMHFHSFDDVHSPNYVEDTQPITNDNVLLRGSTLRNTKFVLGLVIYTGAESKIMLNSGITPTKKSRISSELNLSVICNFGLLFILCFVSGLVNGLFYDKKNVSRLFFEYKPYASTSALNGIVAFFVALVIYQTLVPISLYISIEIVKTVQAYFIYSDAKMYYPKLDYPCVPKSWNISDDLGQIEYVFSDKTGTLTQNVMEFKKCTIAGKSYGLAYTEAKQGLQKRQGIDVVSEGEKMRHIIADDREEMIDLLVKNIPNDQFREKDLIFTSSEYVSDIIKQNSTQSKKNKEFMLALALCHTVVTEEDLEDENHRIFKAESPDEAALVSVARDLGIVFHERKRKSLLLDIYGERKEYKWLEQIPFTSARKRMSAIMEVVNDDGSSKVLLICKGADNVIFERLRNDSDQELIQRTALHLEDYAKEGLRTLCIAQKEIDRKTFENWLERYKQANASISDNREELIEKLDEEIEAGLTLLGGTAIEDRLQAGVPDSIAILGQAGIKLWVLTGDRIETAINIGFSCNLLENDMKLIVVRPDENNPEDLTYIDDLITNSLHEDFNMNGGKEELIAAKNDHSTPQGSFAVIVDGAALTLIFDGGEDIRRKFLLLCKQCKAVLCCRVSPSQKAEVVKLVKNSLDVMTLAIGDGANDVAMIQAANVGVGIAGEEGRQAVMSADYGIGQFRFVTRLVLVHGRWSYKRLAEMIPCFFYKNVVFTLTFVWFAIYNNFDGSYLYEYTYLMFYNLAFTSLPVIFLAAFDQDVSDTISLLVPQLYRTGILRLEWSQYKFFYYMTDGLYQSVICFFFPYLTHYVGFANAQGLAVNHRFWIGVLVANISVTSCNLYVLLQQYRWDWLTLLIDGISVLLVFFWGGVWSASTYSEEFYKAGSQTFGTLATWCCYFVAVVICILPRFVYDFLRRNFRPQDIDIIRERYRQGHYNQYPVGYDPTDAEDVELFRKFMATIKNENSGQAEEDLENSVASSSVYGTDAAVPQIDVQNTDHHEDSNVLSRTFKSLRRATISRSKRSTSGVDLNHLKKPLTIAELRQEMVRAGEVGHGGRGSFDRISASQELPGLTQAETLLSYHTRNSIIDH